MTREQILFVVIMPIGSEYEYNHIVLVNAVHQTMFLCDTPAPSAFEKLILYIIVKAT